MLRDYQDVVDAITRRIGSVTGIGNVHPGRMLTQDGNEFNAIHFCQSQSRIHSWTVTRERFSDEQVATGNTHDVVHSFRIRGHMALLNAINSDLQFQRLVNAVANALDDDSDLDGVCELQFPVQAEQITERDFYDITVHYCELTLDVREHHKST